MLSVRCRLLYRLLDTIEIEGFESRRGSTTHWAIDWGHEGDTPRTVFSPAVRSSHGALYFNSGENGTCWKPTRHSTLNLMRRRTAMGFWLWWIRGACRADTLLLTMARNRWRQDFNSGVSGQCNDARCHSRPCANRMSSSYLSPAWYYKKQWVARLVGLVHGFEHRSILINLDTALLRVVSIEPLKSSHMATRNHTAYVGRALFLRDRLLNKNSMYLDCIIIQCITYSNRMMHARAVGSVCRPLCRVEDWRGRKVQSIHSSETVHILYLYILRIVRRNYKLIMIKREKRGESYATSWSSWHGLTF